MREFYTTSEATENKFLFISYSHADKSIVESWADHLINNGVRVWMDRAFLGGDDWETIAKNLLSHENCCGILFFCSESAIKSPNVAKEWRAAAKTKQSRGDFYSQIIMVTDDPNFDYKYLTSFVKKTEELFSDEDYDDFRDLFGKKDHLYYSSVNDTDKQALVNTIKAKTPEAVDEHEVIRDKLADISNLDKEVILKLGTFGTNSKPILWHQIRMDGNNATLLCKVVLTDDLGENVDAWLKDFLCQSFPPEAQVYLRNSIRLLTVEEAETLSQEELSVGTGWWLNDRTGHLQSIVREDGSIYKVGYNNKRYKKGIRPAITLDITTLYSIATNQN